MDIEIGKNEGLTVSVSKETQHIDIGSPKSVEIKVSPQSLNIEPRKSEAPVFQFVQRVIAGANVIRCTLAEFQAIGDYDGRTWYAVTTTSDELRYLYLGNTLVAKASDDGGTWGFAYTFPMTFGR